MGFKANQAELTSYLRDPDNVAAPAGIEKRRLRIYQDLIFNNIEGFLSGSFPVLRELYQKQDWLVLVRAFVKHHPSHSPYFLHISQEFIQFLQQEFEPRPADPAFILELAHYEWVELALDVATDSIPVRATAVDQALHLTPADLLPASITLSPLAWPLSYQFPVHQISPEFQPEQPAEQVTFIVAYRQAEVVKFLQTNGPTVRLLVLLSQQPGSTVEALLETLAVELKHPNIDQFLQFGCQMIGDLIEKEIVYLTP